MKGRSLTTIVGFGIVTALFLAIMSMFYMQQIPTQADLDRLESEMRHQHGIYLAAAAPLTLELIRPDQEGERTGIRIVCSMRPDIARSNGAIDRYLDRIGESVLAHPDWRGRVAHVTVEHAPPRARTRTIRAAPATASGS